MNMDTTKYWIHKDCLIVVTILLAVFLFAAVMASNQMSPVCDEMAHHVAAGYSYVKTLDFRMNPAQPPLIREFIGLPLLFLDLKLPTDHISWQTNDSLTFGRLFFYEYNKNTEDIIFWSRVPTILLAAVLGFLIFLWAKILYGEKAGIFALFLYGFSPAILGNAGLAMIDIGGSLFIFLAIFQYWRLLRCKDRVLLNLILGGIFFGLAQSAKITAAILYPIFFILALACAGASSNRISAFLRQLKFLIAIFIVGFFTLWATYAFEFKPLLENAPDVKEKIDYIRQFCAFIPFLNRPYMVDKFIYFAREIPIPLSTYIVTFLGIIRQTMVGQGLYFMGQDLAGGSRLHYLVDFLIKTPLPMIIFIFFSCAFSLFKKRTKRALMDNMFLLTPILFLFLVVSFSRLQGGIRYILPIYPLLFIWTSDIVNVDIKKVYSKRLLKGGMIFLCGWYLFISVSTYPHYLAYFNDLVGGIDGKGYKITHDLDWGQDLKSLGKYVKENNVEEVVLCYFGTAEPSFYGIKYRLFSPEERKKPLREVYAISVRYLRTAEWTSDHEPAAKAGYSIFIYDFREKGIK